MHQNPGFFLLLVLGIGLPDPEYGSFAASDQNLAWFCHAKNVQQSDFIVWFVHGLDSMRRKKYFSWP